MSDIDHWAEQEAFEAERLDADLEWAGAVATANAIHAAEKGGQCFHGSAVGYVGQVYRPEQEGLKAGQVACTSHIGGCNAVWESEAAYDAALSALHADL